MLLTSRRVRTILQPPGDSRYMAENLLLLESSGSICSVALYDRISGSVSLRESGLQFNHAVEMGQFVDELLSENDLSVEDIMAVAVSEGPGSYTGLRIGSSLAKGICYGAGIPMIAISSLKSLAYLALRDYRAGVLQIADPDNTLIVSLTDARRMEVYRAVYNMQLDVLMQPESHILDDSSFREYLENGRTLLLVGDGALKTAEKLSSCEDRIICTDILPSAAGLSVLASEAFDRGEIVDTAYWEPRYLKEFVAKQSKKNLL